MRNELGSLICNLEWENMKYGEHGFGSTQSKLFNSQSLLIKPLWKFQEEHFSAQAPSLIIGFGFGIGLDLMETPIPFGDMNYFETLCPNCKLFS